MYFWPWFNLFTARDPYAKFTDPPFAEHPLDCLHLLEANERGQHKTVQLLERKRGRQMADIYFQKAPGQELAKNGRFPMIPEEKFNSRPKGLQMAENLLPKGSRPGFGQKRPFPNDPRREIQ